MTNQTANNGTLGNEITAKGTKATWVAVTLACWLGIGMMGAGCSEDEAPTSTAGNTGYASAQNREPPPPLWNLSDVNMHEKVQFPEHVMPKSRDVADVVASFASALVSGNNMTLQGLLGLRDRAVLREMVDHGDWDRYAQEVASIRVSVLEEQGDGFRLGLGVMSNKIAYLTGWEAVVSDGAWTFTGLHVQRIEADRLALLDGASLEPPAPNEAIAGTDVAPTVPDEEEPPEEGVAPAGGGFGTGGGGGLGRPPDF